MLARCVALGSVYSSVCIPIRSSGERSPNISPLWFYATILECAEIRDFICLRDVQLVSPMATSGSYRQKGTRACLDYRAGSIRPACRVPRQASSLAREDPRDGPLL